MTITGRAARQRPDIDALAPIVVEVATHTVQTDSLGDRYRDSGGAERADVLGAVDPATGAYRSMANAVDEAQRRALKLRRNGRPRR